MNSDFVIHVVKSEHSLTFIPNTLESIVIVIKIMFYRVMAVPATVVYFTCYEQLKVAFRYKDDNPFDWWKPMAAGAVARGVY